MPDIIDRMDWLERILNYTIITALLLGLSFSDLHLETINDRVHILAADYGFDFSSWTLDAMRIKLGQSALGAPRYFSTFDQHQVVVQYLQLVASIENTQNRIDVIYADPAVKDAAQASVDLRQQLSAYNDQQALLAPFAESVLQQQVAQILDEKDLTVGGQPVPWVLYHVTPLPQDLIISARGKIEQETSYQLEPDLTVGQAAGLESAVDKKLGVSSLVVDIGGLATYPTMIMRTTALDWLSNTIAHEWTHLYLGERPLGMSYDNAPELRTMNETTASIAGEEIGRIVMQRYYPELAQANSPAQQLVSHAINPNAADAAPFDYRAEMHTTRVQADALLAAGKIDAAEAYMEQRRQVFWTQGYAIRKLNQAYFAFYGAYADVPGGPAGEDPVGPAVRALRKQSASLTVFLERIAQMSTFAQLQQAVGSTASASAGY